MKRLKPKKKKEILIEELVRIENKYGKLIPSDVVKEAKNSKNKIHKFFDHDVEKNSYRYMMMRARSLIRSVRVEVTSKHNSKDIIVKYRKYLPNRKFKNYNDDVKEKEQGYVKTEIVLKKKDLRSGFLQSIVNELETLYHRCYIFSEIRSETEQIKLISESISKKAEKIEEGKLKIVK